MNVYCPSNNKGYRYLLEVSDNFFRYGWTTPLKNKYVQTKTNAFSYFIKESKRKLNLLGSDDGTEYVNK